MRLDRALCNPSWLHCFPASIVNHLSKVSSDHRPISINWSPVQRVDPSPPNSDFLRHGSPTLSSRALCSESGILAETFCHVSMLSGRKFRNGTPLLLARSGSVKGDYFAGLMAFNPVLRISQTPALISSLTLKFPLEKTLKKSASRRNFCGSKNHPLSGCV
ncbi:hypothetical protein K1719_027276 [Acacia pycnantha]|nr:hypothetical protein K1719_027276 [Acacia pycnantha]